MELSIQEMVVYAVIIGAAAFGIVGLIRRSSAFRRGSECSADCGCSPAPRKHP
ncbi:MAG: hypothetical protein IPM21_15370 [Acidobacteria bacterium]|nr:hypothetical protein [Acidobacteriota bacterium]